NYADQSGDATVAITKATASIAVTPYSVTYDGNTHTATGTATGAGGAVLTGLDLAATTHTNAGSYTDTWTITDATGNYRNASSTVTNAIGKATATVTVTGFSGVYDGQEHGVSSSSAVGVNQQALSGVVIAAAAYPKVPGGQVRWTFSNR